MSLKVLVVGAGGREHALVRQLAGSPHKPVLLAAPGNAGTAQIARNIPVDPADQDRLADLCRTEKVDLVIVGPEDPLIDGLGDHLRAGGFTVFGPDRAAARLEGDKVWAKDILAAAGVPTARYAAFTDRAAAAAYLDQADYPVVVKACGAAQGKGVAVCPDRRAALAHLDLCLVKGEFKDAGRRVLVEECLTGAELSVLAVTDGQAFALLAPSRDYKRIGDGDSGPNTGGMGAFAPVPLGGDLPAVIARRIIAPVMAELRHRGIPYRGVLYAGLMLTAAGPRVLEFNCRFGDPETQVVLPLLAVDLLDLVLATAEGRLGAFLDGLPPAAGAPDAWPGAAVTQWHHHSVVVVGAARGYPGSYRKGAPVQLPAAVAPGTWIIQAGTRLAQNGIRSHGGRVLGAVATGASLQEARSAAYRLLEDVRCEDLVWRHDIAAEVAGKTDRRFAAGGHEHD